MTEDAATRTATAPSTRVPPPPRSWVVVLAVSSLGAGGVAELPKARFPARAAGAKSALLAVAPDLDPVVLERALLAAHTARRAGYGRRKPFLTIIDYDRPSSERRLWVLDLATERLVFHEHVAHGLGTGGERAERWSNQNGSKASSLGLFVTRETYVGRRGYSLRLIGLEPGFNDRAFRRAIVMHGAPYMTQAFKEKNGGLFGQSWGCPALDEAVARDVIDVIRGGSLLFIHSRDPVWLAGSAWLAGRIPRGLARRALGRDPAKEDRPKAERRPAVGRRGARPPVGHPGAPG